MRFLDILVVFRPDLGQISFNLLENAFATQELDFLAIGIAFYRPCAEIKIVWTRKWPTSLGFSTFGKIFFASPFSFLFATSIKFVQTWKPVCSTNVASDAEYLVNATPRVPKGGGGIPGALKFLLWSPEPDNFTDWSPHPFWLRSPEPKEILHGAGSPAFSSLIIRVPRLHWFLSFLITAFLYLFVRVNGHIETESEERTVLNTSRRVCLLVYNDMQQHGSSATNECLKLVGIYSSVTA